MANRKIDRPNSLDMPFLCEIAGGSVQLIRARWLVGLLLLAATAIGSNLKGLSLQERPLYFIGASILLYNAVLSFFLQRTNPQDRLVCEARTRNIVLIQVVFDWLSMTAFLHYTGGIRSSAFPLILTHVFITALLMSRWLTFFFIFVDVGTLGGIALLERAHVLPHYDMITAAESAIYTDLLFIISRLAFVTIIAFVIGFVMTSVMIRHQERDSRTFSLLQAAQTISATLDIQALVDNLTESITQSLNAHGASVRLIEETTGRLILDSSYGLSENFLKKSPLELTLGAIENEVLASPPLVVDECGQDDRVQYPKAAMEEGIRSMVTVPLRWLGKPKGILSVYAQKSAHFSPADADLVMKIASIASTALENATSYRILQQQDSERARFVRIVTHELRSPVAGAQSLVRTMLRGLVGEFKEEQFELIERISVRLDQLKALIDDLLALASGRMEDLTKPFEWIALQPYLQDLVDRLQPEAASKQIELNLDAPPDLLYVQATEEGLSRIFDNLLGNAIKYTPAGGRVSVVIQEKQGKVVVQIADTGIGIPLNDQPHIWDEFYRARNVRQAGILGTGLGLSIAKAFVDQFGGLLTAESKEGEGSTFTLILPADFSSSPRAGRSGGPEQEEARAPD
jgi:signal transduction histidine kinase